MGCDIHFFAEKRNSKTDKWEFLPAPGDGMDYTLEREAEERGEEYDCPHPYRSGTTSATCTPGYDDRYWKPSYAEGEDGYPQPLRDWFDDRNYRLFGMLADVRNGTGFAGCDMGDAVEPILNAKIDESPTLVLQDGRDAYTRGWPDDCCPELEAERKRIEHTPSWLTVAEMQAYFERKRDEPIVVRGVVTGEHYEALRDHGTKPSSWSGGISGQRILTVSPAIYEAIDSDKLTHTKTKRGFDRVQTTIDVDDLPEGLLQNEWNKLNTARILGPLRGQPVGTVDTQITLYVRAEWCEPSDESIGRFEACLAEMVEVSGCDPENVRAVFYFDS